MSRTTRPASIGERDAQGQQRLAFDVDDPGAACSISPVRRAAACGGDGSARAARRWCRLVLRPPRARGRIRNGLGDVRGLARGGSTVSSPRNAGPRRSCWGDPVPPLQVIVYATIVTPSAEAFALPSDRVYVSAFSKIAPLMCRRTCIAQSKYDIRQTGFTISRCRGDWSMSK